jgi:uncharacterized protein GlcG (DUF336 family)
MLIITALALTLTVQTPAPRLDDEAAQEIIAGCKAFADERELTVAVAVLDDRLSMVAYRRMDGLREGPAQLAIRKARYSAEWGGETKGLENAVGENRLAWAFSSRGPATEGGVPIYTSDGTILGGVGVSGASAEEDAQCAKAGIKRAGLEPARP